MENKYLDLPVNSAFCLSSEIAYQQWRSNKLRNAEKLINAPIIEIKQLTNPSDSEKTEILNRCKKINMAIYQTNPSDNQDEVRVALRNLVEDFGLKIAEKHRSQGKNGIVAITISNKKNQKAYMPYSNRAMNWHNDGYYNAPNEQIRSMILHCYKPAKNGGISQFFDNDIAYIRLRDENPEYIKALMHPKAMTIPQNLEETGKLRKASVGPVFSTDKNGENLFMRYTARTRSIEWRKDAITTEAVAFLQSLLEKGDKFMTTIKLKAGQGIICNNSLHNRTSFETTENENDTRIMFRVRFHNRITGE